MSACLSVFVSVCLGVCLAVCLRFLLEVEGLLTFLVSCLYFTEEIYMTTNSYKAKKEDEISFDIGVNLHVKEKTLDGWWRVV